jgi:hypothetical protein
MAKSRKFGKQLQNIFNFQTFSNRKKSETSDKMRLPKRNRKPPAKGALAAKAPGISKRQNSKSIGPVVPGLFAKLSGQRG